MSRPLIPEVIARDERLAIMIHDGRLAEDEALRYLNGDIQQPLPFTINQPPRGNHENTKRL